VQVHHQYSAVFHGFAFSVKQQQQPSPQQQQQRRQRHQLWGLLHSHVKGLGLTAAHAAHAECSTMQGLLQPMLHSHFQTQQGYAAAHAASSSRTVQDVLQSLAADTCVTGVYPDRTGKLRAALMASHPRAAAAARYATHAATAAAALHPAHLQQRQQQGFGNNIRRLNAAVGNLTRGAAAVAVAVIDTGIAEHPDVSSVIQSIDCIGFGHSSTNNGISQYRYPVKQGQQGLGCSKVNKRFDLIGHGTMVAGILVGKPSSSSSSSKPPAGRTSGVTGVAPGTPLYALHVVEPDASASNAPNYSFTLSDVIAALEWVLLHNAQQQQQRQRQQQHPLESAAAARPKIRVVNLSLGDYSVSAAACC
jgi:subtilisin family serine protease